MEKDLVEERRWISREDYVEGLVAAAAVFCSTVHNCGCGCALLQALCSNSHEVEKDSGTSSHLGAGVIGILVQQYRS